LAWPKFAPLILIRILIQSLSSESPVNVQLVNWKTGQLATPFPIKFDPAIGHETKALDVKDWLTHGLNVN